MGKKDDKSHNSIWSFFSFFHAPSFSLRKRGFRNDSTFFSNRRLDFSIVTKKFVFSSPGFTLIEMIIVIAILGILSVLVFLSLDPLTQSQKAHDAQRKSDLGEIRKALEQYYQDNNKYPDSSGATGNPPYAIKNPDLTVVSWGTSWSPYLSPLPKDPNPSQKYVYFVKSGVNSDNNQSYYLFTSLERGGKDPQACNKGNACTSLSSLGISDTACGQTCNFGVSSANVSVEP